MYRGDLEILVTESPWIVVRLPTLPNSGATPVKDEVLRVHRSAKWRADAAQLYRRERAFAIEGGRSSTSPRRWEGAYLPEAVSES